MRWPSGTFSLKYDDDMAIVRTKTQWAFFLGFLGLMIFAGFVLPESIKTVITTMFIYIVAVQGLQLLTGYTGQISIAQSAFMGIGAFTTGMLSVKFEIMSYWAALPFAGLAAASIGAIFGIPSFRVKGWYLALISLAAQVIIMWVIVHAAIVTGGVTGIAIPSPRIGSHVLNNTDMFFLAGTLAGLATLFIKNIVRTRPGRAFIAVRDNETAAGVMGIDVPSYKLLAFFIANFFAGIAGWFWAGYMNMANVDHYSLESSIWFLAMIVIGGLGSTAGSILGVVFVEAIREFTVVIAPTIADISPWPFIGMGIGTALPMLTLGVVVILFVIFEPRGLVHTWDVFRRSYRLWPYSR